MGIKIQNACRAKISGDRARPGRGETRPRGSHRRSNSNNRFGLVAPSGSARGAPNCGRGGRAPQAQIQLNPIKSNQIPSKNIFFRSITCSRKSLSLNPNRAQSCRIVEAGAQADRQVRPTLSAFIRVHPRLKKEIYPARNGVPAMPTHSPVPRFHWKKIKITKRTHFKIAIPQ